MESLLHALSAVKTCVQAHGTEYQKEAFKALEVLAQQTNNRSSVPCGDCGKLLPINMQCDNPECVRVIMRHGTH